MIPEDEGGGLRGVGDDTGQVDQAAAVDVHVGTPENSRLGHWQTNKPSTLVRFASTRTSPDPDNMPTGIGSSGAETISAVNRRTALTLTSETVSRLKQAALTF